MPGLPSSPPQEPVPASLRVFPTHLDFTSLAHQEQASLKICVQVSFYSLKQMTSRDQNLA